MLADHLRRTGGRPFRDRLIDDATERVVIPDGGYVDHRRRNVRTDVGRSIYDKTRNVAGLVINRTANVSPYVSTAMVYVSSIWNYDTLGRVVDQTVTKGPTTSPTQVVRQHLQY